MLNTNISLLTKGFHDTKNTNVLHSIANWLLQAFHSSWSQNDMYIKQVTLAHLPHKELEMIINQF